MSKKLTKQEFVDKAILIHGNKYDYSKVDYVNTITPVIIICPIHGEFKQIPNSHLSGSGCLKCGAKIRSIKKTNTTENFIKKANLSFKRWSRLL